MLFQTELDYDAFYYNDLSFVYSSIVKLFSISSASFSFSLL